MNLHLKLTGKKESVYSNENVYSKESVYSKECVSGRKEEGKRRDKSDTFIIVFC